MINVLESEYLNPFGINLDGEDLLNLSSGQAFQGDTDDLLNIWHKGKELYDQFLQQRIRSNEKNFHDTLPRNKTTLFNDSGKVDRKIDSNKTEVIKANRNILGKLLCLSAKTAEAIDFSKALTYPLYPVPLSLAHPDGTKRQTQKSKLLEILQINDQQPSNRIDNASILVIDMIAQIRLLVHKLPDTLEDYIVKFLTSIPKNYEQVDIVADCYREISIKSAERNKRGKSSKVLMSSYKSKIPRDFPKFLSNSDNKKQLIDLTFKYIRENASKCLSIIKANSIIISGDYLCQKITLTECSDYDTLRSDQEEADTKVVLHTLEALSNNPQANVVLRSPSGDTDIMVIALGLISEKDRVKFDYGSGVYRKQIWLNEINLPINLCQGIIGFHAFTGNDYISTFFRKGKLMCWRTMIKDERFVEAFTNLGEQWQLEEDTKIVIEEYVCRLYSSKSQNIDDARFQIFMKSTQQRMCLSIYQICHRVNLHYSYI